jgi:signal transduction histidine kinase
VGFDVATAHRFVVVVDDTPPYRVWADRSWLERVVVNLLTNALKYSPAEALVQVRLAHVGDAVVLEVVDCGIGIDPESIKLLFGRYYRTATGRATAAGSGLGLYITRLIVEAHGGHIDVSSEVGKGSRFKVVLPSRQDAVTHPDMTSSE